MLKTKIIATLGPSTNDVEIVKKMVREGVAGFRINFSHGDKNMWDKLVDIVRNVSEEYEQPIALIGDLKGPQVRIGSLDGNIMKVERDRIVRFIQGDKGASGEVPVKTREVFEIVEVGDIILVGDGECILRVVENGEDYILAKALFDGVIGSGKKIVIKGKEPNLPSISYEDLSLIKYAVEKDFTFLGISYVRSSRDIITVRNIIRDLKGSTGIIAKIETPAAYRNLEEIVKSSDVVLIARGDLGLHFDLDKLPIIQKGIVSTALKYSRPVIVATQLLESMVEQPIPSRSEVIDVYNAVNDGVDALMLTNETAVGKYPLETVKWLKKIIESTESSLRQGPSPVFAREHFGKNTIKDKYVYGLLSLAESIDGKVLIFSKTGSVPPLISMLRPRVPVIVGTPDKVLARRLVLYYGLKVYDMSKNIGLDASYEDGIRALEELSKLRGDLSIGDIVVESFAKPGGEMHEIIIKRVV
ncbi:pyruvate kinase [Thermogladius sp. 4427co]|uniref:pyruvate kinase n=1 Tax=Thermogladius sp. 4427co TaxID=3450718 RepID=UPI003F7A4A4E